MRGYYLWLKMEQSWLSHDLHPARCMMSPASLCLHQGLVQYSLPPRQVGSPLSGILFRLDVCSTDSPSHPQTQKQSCGSVLSLSGNELSSKSMDQVLSLYLVQTSSCPPTPPFGGSKFNIHNRTSDPPSPVVIYLLFLIKNDQNPRSSSGSSNASYD